MLVFLFGQISVGNAVNERNAMQVTAFWQKPLRRLPPGVYRYTKKDGKDKVLGHRLYALLYDESNPVFIVH